MTKRAHRAPQDSGADRAVRTTFAVILVTLALTAIFALRTTRAAVDSGRWVEHTLAVERELAELASSMREAEAAYLEFIITGQAESTRRLEATRLAVTGHLQRIEGLTVDNPSQQRRIVDLRRIINDDIARRTVVMAKPLEERWEAARSLLMPRMTGGSGSVDVVRSRIGEMVSEEERLLLDRSGRASAEAERASTLGSALGLFAVLAMGIGYIVIRTDARSRRVVLEAIRRSEESLATTLNSIGDGVIATDATGRIVRMNPVAEQLTGWLADAAKGKELADVFHILNEETRSPVESPAGTVLREGKVVGLGNHTLLVSRDGAERAIADSGAPIRDEDGKMRGVVVVFRDQTEERKAERALKRSEARFRRLMDSGVIGILLSDLSGNITEANDAFLSMVGYSREDLCAGRISGTSLNDPEKDSVEIVASAMRQAKAVAAPWEKEFVRKDGSRVPVLIGATMLDETTGVGLVTDLTEKRRAEAALRSSEARLTALYEAGIIGIIVTTLDGRVVEINDALLHTVGYDRAEIVSGKVPWTSLTPPDWRDSDSRAVDALKTKGVTALREKEYFHKDGTRVPVIAGSTVLAGTTDEAISFVLDLTDNKQAALAVSHLREVGASEAKFRGLLEAAPDAVVIVASAPPSIRN